MKLNTTQLDLLSQIEEFQSARRRRAWSGFLALAIFIAAGWYFGQLGEFTLGALLALTVMALMHVIRIGFEIGHEYKLIEMLKQYVNRDAESIAQLSKHNRPTNDIAAA